MRRRITDHIAKKLRDDELEIEELQLAGPGLEYLSQQRDLPFAPWSL